MAHQEDILAAKKELEAAVAPMVSTEKAERAQDMGGFGAKSWNANHGACQICFDRQRWASGNFHVTWICKLQARGKDVDEVLTNKTSQAH